MTVRRIRERAMPCPAFSRAALASAGRDYFLATFSKPALPRLSFHRPTCLLLGSFPRRALIGRLRGKNPVPERKSSIVSRQQLLITGC
jgi:hypothetical protein